MASSNKPTIPFASRLEAALRRRLRRAYSLWKSITLLDPKISSLAQLQQMNLKAALRNIRENGRAVGLLEFPFRVFSQVDEDGILLTILSQIGIDRGRCVEIGAGLGPYAELECNTANLLVHHAWEGLIVDGGSENTDRLRSFFERNAATWHSQPRVVKSFITAENINTILTEHEFTGDIDLLTLDIDGVDWWVLRSLTVAKPKILVVEFNDIWAYGDRKTIPYSATFDHHKHNAPGTDAHYYGASLGAFVTLAQAKGYRFLGINGVATNAFFLRDDVHAPTLATKSPADCMIGLRTRNRRRLYYETIRAMEWMDVSDLSMKL